MLGGFFKDEAGASAVEYTILLAFISLVILVAITALGQTLSNVFTNFVTTLASATGS